MMMLVMIVSCGIMQELLHLRFVSLRFVPLNNITMFELLVAP